MSTLGLPTGSSAPISSYSEFSKIFNPKSVGREGGGSFVSSKNNRKSSFENNGNLTGHSGSYDDSTLIGVGPSGKQ